MITRSWAHHFASRADVIGHSIDLDGRGWSSESRVLASERQTRVAVDGEGDEMMIPVLVLTAVATLSAQSPDEDAIRARLSAYAKATETATAADRVKFYAADVDMWMSTTNKLTVGRTAVEKELAAMPRPPQLTFALDVERITLLNPDTALVDAGYRASIGDEKIAGHVFYVLVRREGQWVIRSVRATQTRP